ncbi:MAG: dihydrofolate reductase [Thermodesulfobacteriota bacterium]
MGEIIIIAAVAANNIIGNKGKIPWHISDDFKRFKRLTLGHPVIMGRRTYESLPLKPLPGRLNIVITGKSGFEGEEVTTVPSLKDAITQYTSREKLFLIGGEQVYREGLVFATHLEITRLNAEYEGDTSFPEIDPDDWEQTGAEPHDGYSFISYKRRG